MDWADLQKYINKEQRVLIKNNVDPDRTTLINAEADLGEHSTVYQGRMQDFQKGVRLGEVLEWLHDNFQFTSQIQHES